MAISGPGGGAGGAGGSDYRPMADINVTPLVDVMLVLLIIFMVAAPLLIQGVPVQLPKTSAAKLTDAQKKTLIVTLAPGGIVNIGNDPVTIGDLPERLRDLRQREGDDKIVYVRADRSIPYGDVMRLLGKVGEAGFGRVSLLSEAAPETAIKAN